MEVWYKVRMHLLLRDYLLNRRHDEGIPTYEWLENIAYEYLESSEGRHKPLLLFVDSSGAKCEEPSVYAERIGYYYVGRAISVGDVCIYERLKDRQPHILDLIKFFVLILDIIGKHHGDNRRRHHDNGRSPEC